MRKILLSFFLCCICFITVHAERPRPFEVKRLSNWAPEYLTITKTYWISGVAVHNLDNCPVKEEQIWMEVLEGGNLSSGIVILSIDGQTTKKMSEQAFYRITAQKDEHELVVCDAENGGYEYPFTVKFRIKEPPMWMQQCMPYSQEQIVRGENIPGVKTKPLDERKALMETLEKENKRLQQDFKMYWDKDFDWFSIRTYDFIPTQDPLADKVLMEKFIEQFPRLKRDIENPDVVIRLTKNEQESAQSTYIPPTQQVVNEGSTTRTFFNYFTKGYSFQTQQKNRIIKDGDYVKTTKTDDLYLEIAMLDTKRLGQTSPPIIYQLKYKRHIVNRNFDIEKEYLNLISCCTDPYYTYKGTSYQVTSYETITDSQRRTRRKILPDYMMSYSGGVEKYFFSYYRVVPTRLANPHVLGTSIFKEGDIVQKRRHTQGSGAPSFRDIDKAFYYSIVERDGEKIKKKDQKEYKANYDADVAEDRNSCVIFNIWSLAIDE